MRPPSPIGRALDDVCRDVYGGNRTRLTEALGVARSTLYKWLELPDPRIEELDHRQALARVLSLDLRSVDTLIVTGLGYQVTPVPSQAVNLGVLAARLDAEDIALLERQALAMLRRDAELRKGRRRRG